MTLRRTPATAAPDATYPTLSEHGQARRRVLRLCALSSAAAALGLQLTGCTDPQPGGAGTGGGTGNVGGGTGNGGGGTGSTGGNTTGGGNVGGTGGGSSTDWVPWEEDRIAHIRGRIAMPVGKPVALVIGDAPIELTFADGVTRKAVVAVTVRPRGGARVQVSFAARTKENTQLVLQTAKSHDSDALTDAAKLEGFEKALATAIAPTITGGNLETVSVAPVKAADAPAERREAPKRADSGARMRRAANAPAPVAQSDPQAEQLWVACGTPGCDDCGAGQ